MAVGADAMNRVPTRKWGIRIGKWGFQPGNGDKREDREYRRLFEFLLISDKLQCLGLP